MASQKVKNQVIACVAKQSRKTWLLKSTGLFRQFALRNEVQKVGSGACLQIGGCGGFLERFGVQLKKERGEFAFRPQSENLDPGLTDPYRYFFEYIRGPGSR